MERNTRHLEKKISKLQKEVTILRQDLMEKDQLKKDFIKNSSTHHFYVMNHSSAASQSKRNDESVVWFWKKRRRFR